ncbi:MAG: hypothetical protein V4596_00070 [Bdellovibrionota bacterium]
MKLFAFITALSISVTSFAGIDIGKYEGTSQKGEPCKLEVLSYSYENDVHHPLNERVTIVENGTEWIVRHPPVINEEEGKVRFNHNFFETVSPTPTGAKFLKMTINHDAEPHAPTSYTFIEDNYKDATKSVKEVCSGLVKVK